VIHTPYDGSSKLFQIGLKPLGHEDWIESDATLPAFLAEKARIWREHPDEVFVAEPGTEDGQSELLALLVGYLPRRHPELYRREGDSMVIVPTGDRVSLDSVEPPLMTAARLVADDLILLRKSRAGWRLAAGSLSFPSAWSLREKFGRPMHEIHGPVPGFGAGTRNAELIERMFDNLRPAIAVLRWNWSLYGDAELFHPQSHEPAGRRFGAGERAHPVFIRLERQTLRKLPASGDIVFTIRIVVDPLEALETHPDAATLAPAMIAQLEELTPEQVAYKGLTAERERLIARLREIGAH
jgi:hypothetical protein